MDKEGVSPGVREHSQASGDASGQDAQDWPEVTDVSASEQSDKSHEDVRKTSAHDEHKSAADTPKQDGPAQQATRPDHTQAHQQPAAHAKKEEPKREPRPKRPLPTLRGIYQHHHHQLLLIPILLLIGSLVVIGVNYARTGELIAKDVSLKGGVTLTVFNAPDIDVDALEVELQQHFKADATVRGLREAGTQRGLIIDSGEIDPTALSDYIEDRMGITKDDYTLEMIGAALGSSFFKQALSAVIYAFLFMAIVVFAIFRSPMPSFYVVLAAVSDIVMTWATLILLGVKLSTAGIAGFLMLIGYSVDTDILLTTRVLKRKHISVFDATMGAMKTGLTMTLASMAAVIVALIVTTSDTLHQIMLILLIGLIADIINTWLQNAVLLRIYMKKTHKVD